MKRQIYTLITAFVSGMILIGLASCSSMSPQEDILVPAASMRGQYKGELIVFKSSRAGVQNSNYLPGGSLTFIEKVKTYKDIETEVDETTISIDDFPLEYIALSVLPENIKIEEVNGNKDFDYKVTYRVSPQPTHLIFLPDPMVVSFSVSVKDARYDITAVLRGINTYQELLGYFIPRTDMLTMGLHIASAKVNDKEVTNFSKYWFYLKQTKKKQAAHD